MTSGEFKILYDKNDEVCVLAQFFLLESHAYTVRDLSCAKGFIIDKFVDRARRLIEELKKHNLHIIYDDKNAHIAER